LFSSKQPGSSSAKLSGLGDSLNQNFFCAAHRLLCKSVHYDLHLGCQVDCNKSILLSHRSTMPSWMTLCTQQRLSASGYDTRWTDPERSRFASLHYLLRSITNAVFVSGSNSCLMRLEQLSAARTGVILCVASSMHLSCAAVPWALEWMPARIAAFTTLLWHM